jgi:hypothetical protein
MNSLRALLLSSALASLVPAPAAACNPDPPRPPVLEGYRYDAMAAGHLVRESDTVAAARLATVLELELELDDGRSAGARTDYVFEVLEGWNAVVPRRLVIGGHWVDCAIEPRVGRVFLLYLDGTRLLHAVPVEQLDVELQLLGEPAWFYDAGGRLVRVLEE